MVCRDLDMMKWGKKVLILKGDRSISSLARAIGISQPALSGSISESRKINASSGILLARELGVTAEWLFTDELGMEEIEYLDRPTSEGDIRRRRVKSAVDFFNDDSPELEEVYELVVKKLHDRVAEEKRVIDTKPHPKRIKNDKPHTAGSAV